MNDNNTNLHEMTILRFGYTFTFSDQVEPIQRMFRLVLFVSIKTLEGVLIEKGKNQSEQPNQCVSW